MACRQQQQHHNTNSGGEKPVLDLKSTLYQCVAIIFRCNYILLWYENKWYCWCDVGSKSDLKRAHKILCQILFYALLVARGTTDGKIVCVCFCFYFLFFGISRAMLRTHDVGCGDICLSMYITHHRLCISVTIKT